MRIPPLLIGSATVFWGFSTGWEIFSMVAAVIFEASALIRTRFELKERDFVRISDISSLVMLILLFYSYLENEPRQIFLAFIASIPIVFMPLLFAQLYSTSDKVVIGTAFGGKTIHKHRPVDIRTVYMMAIVTGASSTVNKNQWFFPILFILILIFLSGSVVNRKTSVRFMIFALIAFIGSIALSDGIVITHMALRSKMMELYRNWYKSQNGDPFKTSTALGETGYLKLSGNIVMRVRPENREYPIYIKSADYNILSGNVWHSRYKKTTNIRFDKDMEWQLFGEGKGSGKIFISTWMGRNGKGILQLPIGAKRAINLDVVGLEKTELGTITVDEGPELLNYDILYEKDKRFEPPPQEKDMLVPKKEVEVLKKVVEENSLKGLTPAQTVENVSKYFSEFTYTLDLSSKEGESVLEDFLLRTKSGHCEYFATATVLLLRVMGIPARYSVGYSVSEYSTLEDVFIARERDGHAWVTAWIDNRWITVDNTPPQWRALDKEKKSIFEPIKDFFSWLRVEYEMFRRQKSETFNHALIIMAAVLTVFMMIKIYLRKKIVSGNGDKKDRLLSYTPRGLNSPFYDVLNRCRLDNMPKKDQESLRQWLERSRERLFEAEKLSVIVRLHEELRFNPDVDAAVSEKLTELCGEWLEQYQKNKV